MLPCATALPPHPAKRSFSATWLNPSKASTEQQQARCNPPPGKNPRTGEALKIAATTVPRFTAGAAFKAAVAKKKK